MAFNYLMPLFWDPGACLGHLHCELLCACFFTVQTPVNNRIFTENRALALGVSLYERYTNILIASSK